MLSIKEPLLFMDDDLSRASYSTPLTIEVVYLSLTEQLVVSLNTSENTSLLEAIRLSHLLEKCPEIDLNRNKVGIFGKILPLDTLLKHGDRVEIYRPLLLDPKEKRFLAVKRKTLPSRETYP